MGRSSDYLRQILKDNQRYQIQLNECHKIMNSQKLKIELLEDENKSLKKRLEKQDTKGKSWVKIKAAGVSGWIRKDLVKK